MNKENIDMYLYEKALREEGYEFIAGCDEVGRGPMAGPLVVAAVILPKEGIEGLNDSKKLSAKKREELSKIIKEKAVDYAITYIDVLEVDELNVYQASKKAMMESVRKLKRVDYVLSDAMPMEFEYPVKDIIKGDSKSASIAAASILAKVERDHYMDELGLKYPEYGFEKHKGYVTKYHLAAIEKYGIISEHRKSFAPVQKVLAKNNLL